MIRALALILGLALGGGLVVACDSAPKRYGVRDCSRTSCDRYELHDFHLAQVHRGAR